MKVGFIPAPFDETHSPAVITAAPQLVVGWKFEVTSL